MTFQLRLAWLRAPLLVVVCALFMFPVYWMVATSLKTLSEVNTYPPTLLPRSPGFGSYVAVLEGMPFGSYLTNSLVVALVSTCGVVISSSLAAFAFAKLHFPGRDALFAVLLATLMLPEIVKLVPTFVLFQRVGWINTLLPLTVPAFFGEAFSIFLLRQFMLRLPDELIEAARIDGAREVRILWSVVLPLTRPALVVVAIFAFQRAWNDFLWPLIVLQDERLRTATLGLYSLRSQPMLGTAYDQIMAATVMVSIPMLVLFVVFQRQFVSGIAVGGSAVKG